MSDDRTPFERQVEDALRAEDAPGRADEHPDDVQLASFLDGALEGTARDRLEAHLADCDACRELVSLAALEVEPLESPAEGRSAADQVARQESTPTPFLDRLVDFLGFGQSHGRLVAVAASVLVAAALALLVPRIDQGEHDSDDGPDFGSFVGDQGDIVRGEGDADAAALRLVDPSFSVVDSLRPSFRFVVEGEPARGRLLVVDEQEVPVGLSEVELRPDGDGYVVDYPGGFPALRPGELYAWKIDVELEGVWVPSVFAPFRVGEDADKNSEP